MTEIERKYLVKTDAFKDEANFASRIFQGFLNTHPDRTVRVRTKGESAYLTIKGSSNKSGTSRFEWEKEIPVSDAKMLLKICEKGIIDKMRYEVSYGNHTIEVDEFFGDNEGLVVAEIELKNEQEAIEKPAWLGKEVTGEIKYYNSQLSKNPYKTWKI